MILASNRADLIDPAILRPGRIDRKIKVNRPNKDRRAGDLRNLSARNFAAGRTARNWPRPSPKRITRTRRRINFWKSFIAAAKKDFLYRGDLASGAIIAAIVERAKSLAIKRSIETNEEPQLTREDLLDALAKGIAENDLFPPTDITEDWLKLTDFDPENVIQLGPIRPRKKDDTGHAESFNQRKRTLLEYISRL